MSQPRDQQSHGGQAPKGAHGSGPPVGRRFHYAWVVLVAAMVLVAVSSGVRHSFAIYIEPLRDSFGWSPGAISFAYFVVFLFAIPTAIWAGALADAIGLRKVIVATTLVFILGMALTSTIGRLWQFYVYYGMLTGGMSTIFAVLLPVTMTYWFERRMGFAVGLLYTGVGFGPMVMAPLFRWLIVTLSWEQAFLIVGLGGAVLMVPAAFLLRGRPGDMGLAAYGSAGTAAGSTGPSPVPTPSMSMGEVRATPLLWVLMAIHFLGCIGHSIILAHIVFIGIEKGLSGFAAAGLISAITGASVVSRFGAAVLTERRGGRSALVLVLLLQGLPVLMLLGTNAAIFIYPLAILFALGYGGEMVCFPVINRRCYGARAPLNSIHAWEGAGGSVGMALGGWMGGLLFDLSGGYSLSIALSGMASLFALPLLLALPHHRRRPAALGVGAASGGG